jgi:hypothetical protein
MIKESKMLKPSKMVQFLSLYPQLDYGQLDGVVKHISRNIKQSPDNILYAALVDSEYAKILVKRTMFFQSQIEDAQVTA